MLSSSIAIFALLRNADLPKASASFAYLAKHFDFIDSTNAATQRPVIPESCGLLEGRNALRIGAGAVVI